KAAPPGGPVPTCRPAAMAALPPLAVGAGACDRGSGGDLGEPLDGVAAEAAATAGPTRQQPSMLAVGTVVWLASELMFFGGLFAAYFTLKADARQWPPPGVKLETLLSGLFTVFLIASSGATVLEVRSPERGNRAGPVPWP